MPDQASDMADRKLTLEWAQLDDDSRALVFGPKTWALFEQAAKEKEMDARHMISKVVAEAFGTIMMDNFVLNRFLGKDDR